MTNLDWMPWIYHWKNRLVWFCVFLPSTELWNIMDIMVMVWGMSGQVTGSRWICLLDHSVHFECDNVTLKIAEGTVSSWIRTKMLCQTKRFTQDRTCCWSCSMGKPMMERGGQPTNRPVLWSPPLGKRGLTRSLSMNHVFTPGNVGIFEPWRFCLHFPEITHSILCAIYYRYNMCILCYINHSCHASKYIPTQRWMAKEIHVSLRLLRVVGAGDITDPLDSSGTLRSFKAVWRPKTKRVYIDGRTSTIVIGSSWYFCFQLCTYDMYHF